MTDFALLMGIGFADAQATIGVPVIANSATRTGVLTPGPFSFLMQNSGEMVEVDQQLNLFQSDLAALGLSNLAAVSANRTIITVDGVSCRITGYLGESADPVVAFMLKIAR